MKFESDDTNGGTIPGYRDGASENPAFNGDGVI